MNETTTSGTGTTGGDPTGGSRGPRVTWDDIRDVRQLSRPVHDRKVAGVASGLARHLDIDPLLVRVAFVVLVFFGGCGLLLYGALWLLLPQDSGERASLPLDDRSLQVAVIGALALGALVLLGFSFGNWDFPWPLLLVGAVAFWFAGRAGASRDQRSQGWAPPGTPGAGAGAYGAPAPSPAASAPASTPADSVGDPGVTAPYATARPTGGVGGGGFGDDPYGPGSTTAPSTAASTTASTADIPGAPTPEPTTWVPSTPLPPRPVLIRPVDPRKRGPVLFGITLALIALSFGVLGLLDVGGLDVVASAYPAVALGVTATMLLVGAFWGRAGGLIPLGLVILLALVATSGAERWDNESTRVIPQQASLVDDEESFGAGEFILDLREVRDPAALDGRTLEVNGGVGRIEVFLPAGLGTSIESNVGVGSSVLLDSGERGGLGISHSAGSHSGTDVADITLEINLGVGEVRVQQDVAEPATAPEGDAR